MTVLHCTRALAITFITPAGVLLAAAPSTNAPHSSPAAGAASHTRAYPSELATRTAPVAMPSPFSATERAELAAAQSQAPALADMRAGFEPTRNEWTWLAIGAGIILLIVLL
ncbi:MAG: hypothetical protein IT453_10315 [Planctomycetes bacterium]|jgi:hypothetical protein|nr:hypothetical protein [Planctomycetota bacterium]